MPKPDASRLATPRLALRVGITGHRQIAAEQLPAIAQRVRDALAAIRLLAESIVRDAATGFATDAPVLRVISPLAEGADRIAAAEGLAAGFDLQCPLPFPREVYAEDFTSAEAKAEFAALLARASAVFELDGTRAATGQAYQTVGRIMLEQSDILIAIWNGQPPEGKGGTAQIVAEAREQDIPVIWIHPDEPASIRFDSSTPGEIWSDRLAEVIRGIVARPGVASDHHGAQPLSHEALCAGIESPGRPILLGWVWRLVVGALTWPHPRPAAPGAKPPAPLPGPFDDLYERANHAAIVFAQRHRGAFVLNALLGVFAVVCALLAVADHHHHTFWVWVELATIAGVLSLIFTARRGRWHQKSIDCRLYAEQLRQMRHLWPMGRVTPVTRPPTHHTFGDPRASAANWHFRAQLRLAGMFSGRFSAEHARACLDDALHGWIGGPAGQVAYHHHAAERFERIDHRLHRLARIFFVLTALACVAHLVVHNPIVAPWLTLLSACLPAAGAAAHAIASHGEFRRLALRSASMAAALERTEQDLRRLAASGLTEESLYRAVAPAAEAMMDEVTDWQILSRKPPIEPA